MKKYLSRLIKSLFLELPVKGRSLSSLAGDLQNSGEKLKKRLTAAKDSPANRSRLRHIIGLERWGVARLKRAPELQAGSLAARDATFQDEHHSYKPAEEVSWDHLIETFAQTRQATVTAHEDLSSAASISVWHNDMGQLSVAAWSRYLRVHADLEAKRIRS